jgi:hypothetical protein
MAEYSFSYRFSDKTLISCLHYIYIPVCPQLLIKAAAVAHLFRNPRGGESWDLCEQHASVGVLNGNVRSHPQPCRVTHPAHPPRGGAEGKEQQGEGEEAHRSANSDCPGIRRRPNI